MNEQEWWDQLPYEKKNMLYTMHQQLCEIHGEEIINQMQELMPETYISLLTNHMRG